MKFLWHVRRMSYAPPPRAGANDNSSFFRLLGLGGLIGGVAYVYYDPDVLPEGVKKLLPIQEPKGKGMTLEEYEQWRSKQGSYPTDSKRNTHHEEKSLKGDMVEDAPRADGIPIPRDDVSPVEMKISLQNALREARENEATYISDLKKSKAAVTEEDRQMLQAFKDEKARIKQQLKFINSSK